MAKSVTFGVVHLGIAFGVTGALTGNVSIAGAVTMVEPVCNTVAHHFLDCGWARRHPAAGLAASMSELDAQTASGRQHVLA